MSDTDVSATGLTQLSQGDRGDFDVDIVFVHGLGGHPYSTWACLVPHSRPLESLSKSTALQNEPIPRKSAVKAKLSAIFGARSDGLQKGSEDGKKISQPSVYWPRDFLASDFTSARVLTWGYNSAVTRGYAAGSQGTIFSHARNLLYSLVSDRADFPDRPLIFVAHSLGGIVVKEVLRRSEVDPTEEVRQIYSSTTGVIFYGTPHRGSRDWASFGEGIAKIATFATGMETNAALIHALLPTGPELEECWESFARQWQARQNSLTVRTYQEGRGPSGVTFGGFHKKIVPDDSSSLDHTSQWARTIDADHPEMCKFHDQKEQAYQWVKADISRLLKFVKSSETILSNRPIEHAYASVARRKEPIQKGLLKTSLEEMSSMDVLLHLFETIEPVGSTCQWILRHPLLLSMEGSSKAESSRLMHVTGKPGCGKTTLSAFLFRQLAGRRRNSADGVRVVLFAFNERRAGRREPINLLASFISQLLVFGVVFPPELEEQWDDRRFVKDKWQSFSALHLAFSLITSFQPPPYSPCKKVIFIIDGLDECVAGDERNRMLNSFKKLVANDDAHPLIGGLIITNRPESGIDFKGAGKYHIDLNSEDAVDVDIRDYIDNEVDQLIQRRPPMQSYADKVKRKLNERAEKMYLLVELLVNLLEGLDNSSAQSIQDMLDSLPSTLTEIYDRLWSKVVDRRAGDRAKLFFSWILCSVTTLTLKDFRILVGRWELDPKLMARRTFNADQRMASTRSPRHLKPRGMKSIGGSLSSRRASGESGASLEYYEMIAGAEMLDDLCPFDMGGDLLRMFGPLVSIVPSEEPFVTLAHQTVKEHFLGRGDYSNVAQLHLEFAEICVRCMDGTLSGDPDTHPVDIHTYFSMKETDTCMGPSPKDPYYYRWHEHVVIAESLDQSCKGKVTLRQKNRGNRLSHSPLRNELLASDSDDEDGDHADKAKISLVATESSSEMPTTRKTMTMDSTVLSTLLEQRAMIKNTSRRGLLGT